jgi:hypothetical protein
MQDVFILEIQFHGVILRNFSQGYSNGTSPNST